MDNAVVIERVLNLVVVLLSLTFHEFFHAWSAYRLGDDTAARMGRLTLNPIPHIDVVGTILPPLLGYPIGWAKPVPVNPARFHRRVTMSKGDIIVSAAGPLSNVVLGTIAAIALGLVLRFVPDASGSWSAVVALLRHFMRVNASLAVFNILPLPPLDGGHVAGNLVPYRWRQGWDRFAQVSPFVVLLVIAFGWPVIGPPVSMLYGVLRTLALAIA